MGREIILCVDDDITVLNALRVVLANSFDENHIIEVAESGQEALEICNELKLDKREISVVVSDFIMPGMNGDELLSRLHLISPNTVKIMLTGQSDIQGVKRAINEANLYRFIEKPFDNSDMMLTAKSALHSYRQERELELRNKELEIINNNLEQLVKERTSALNQSLKVIKEDLSMAKKIQKGILFIKPEIIKDLNVHITYTPMSEVGGDFYDISKVSEFTYRIFLADATGHGVQAAMITMAIKGIFDNLKNLNLDVNQIMELLNNEYMNKYGSINSFMTAVLVDIDVKRRTIKYVSAGHPDAVLIKQNQITLLKNTGKMIGIVKDINYKSLEFAFSPSDRFYAFTDGIFEEFNSNMEEFGEERLHLILAENGDLSMKEIIEDAVTKLEKFLAEKEKQDDITVLGIEYRQQ